MHGGFGNAVGAGRFADGPVRAASGLARQRALPQRGNLLVFDGARASGAQLVIQSGQPILQKTLAPFANRGFGPMLAAICELLSPSADPNTSLARATKACGRVRERTRLLS